MSFKLLQALAFIDRVMERIDDVSVQRQFHHVLINWSGPHATGDVALSLQVILSGHPDLQLLLNEFLPERYRCTPFLPL